MPVIVCAVERCWSNGLCLPVGGLLNLRPQRTWSSQNNIVGGGALHRGGALRMLLLQSAPDHGWGASNISPRKADLGSIMRK